MNQKPDFVGGGTAGRTFGTFLATSKSIRNRACQTRNQQLVEITISAY